MFEEIRGDREFHLVIRLSREEKLFIYEYAKKRGIRVTTLIRGLLKTLEEKNVET